MMEDGTDYMIPIFISQVSSPNSNQTDFQHLLSANNTEDSNRNHLDPNGFYLRLNFNSNRGANRRSSIQLLSHSIEEETRRCQEQLDIIRQTKSRLEAEAGQLERVNEGLRSDNEIRELMALEQAIKRLENELSECQMLANQSTEDLTLKTAVASATRMKRYETECALRELQLSICRRKLEYATARALDTEDDSIDDDQTAVLNLPEEEERIAVLQRELDELNHANNRALSELREAELVQENRQANLTRTKMEVEHRISIGTSECEARRHNLAEKRQQLERNQSYLMTVSQKIALEKLSEIELLQHIALIEAARTVEQLERSAQSILATNNVR